MTSLPRGLRRDSQLANQRRLGLVRRLLRGPATADALIAELRHQLGDDIYPTDARAALRHDMASLRKTFGCCFFYRAGDGYYLTGLGMLTLLELGGDEFEALALVISAMKEGALPDTPSLARLLERLTTLLPPAQRASLGAVAPLTRFGLPEPPPNLAALIARLRPALGRSEIRFQYRSPYSLPDELEDHHVAPYELLQREGFTYLEAYCLESSITKLRGRTILYRLDRLIPASLRRLPRQLPPARYTQHNYRLRYELSAAVARRHDIPAWFDDTVYTAHDDGSATVEATTTDLWYARQVLLRYREHCRVVEPPELIVLIRDAVRNMAALYNELDGRDSRQITSEDRSGPPPDQG